MPGRVPLADRLRLHRQAFELSLELGCTPKEAEQELARRAAADTAAQAAARLNAKINAPIRPPVREDHEAPWMMRD